MRFNVNTSMPGPSLVLLMLVALAAGLPGCGGGSEAKRHYEAGVQLRFEGRWTEAIAEFDHSIRLNPELVQAYLYRGFAYYNLGRFQRALPDFDEAIRLDPENHHAYKDRGKVYLYLDAPDLALQDFDEAIRIDPRYANAHAGRAWAHTLMGDDGAAEEDAGRAVELGFSRAALEREIERLKAGRER
jgi:tetratricopeptide (TPR) repeat protein